MSEIICNTSPIQYLYQLGLLDLLRKLSAKIIIPPAVVDEIATGKSMGVSLPDLNTFDWVEVRRPTSESALPLINDLGEGETEVLMLALELRDSVVILDDDLARRVTKSLNIRHIGTLGVLLDAKRAGLIPKIAPLLDQLDALRFRLAPHTRAAVLKLAGE